ncbi:MAG TPA: hypothetical protein VNC50_04435 [Planctomycetia bacterium]|nr:hypothetical protein [Planctomycetia bacterium]
MHLTFVPLLAEIREFYRLPRDARRFKKYLYLTLDMEKERVRLPLLGMNPMAKEHVLELVENLIAIDAEKITEAAMHEAAAKVEDVPGSFRVALVVIDDLKGGWTNRASDEYRQRSSPPPPPGQQYLDWITPLLWASEPADGAGVRLETLTAIYRIAHVHRHGHARTLGELLAQEGAAMAAAGCETPALDDEELEYTRGVIAPFLESTDMRTCVECLFGDPAARTLGFTPRGLSPRAGLALALAEARAVAR